MREGNPGDLTIITGEAIDTNLLERLGEEEANSSMVIG